MNSIYKDGSYLESNPTWHEEDSPWKASKIVQLIERNDLSPSSICEIGCGAGGILQQLSLTPLIEGAEFIGYEISPQAFELCQQKSKKNLNFYLKDLLEEKDVSFDIVMAIDIFEHIEDYYGFLRRLKDKGEYKIFNIPLDLSVQSVLRESPIMHMRNSVGHLHYFTKGTALATLEGTGYEILDYTYGDAALDLSNRGWKSKMMNVPRRLLSLISKDLAVRVFGGYSLFVLTK